MILRSDKNQVVTGDLAFKGLVSVERFSPLHVAAIELKPNPIAAFPVYDGNRLLGWVPIFDAEPPYQATEVSS